MTRKHTIAGALVAVLSAGVGAALWEVGLRRLLLPGPSDGHAAHEGGHSDAEHAQPQPGELAGGEAGEHAEGQGGEHGGHDEHASDEVHLGPERAAELGIRAEELRAGCARAVLERPARVTTDLDRVSRVGPRVHGKVERVEVDLGDRVQEGDRLAVLSSVELGRAKSAYLSAVARLRTEEQDFRRDQRLHEQEIGSEAAMLESRALYREAQAEVEAARESLRVLGLDEAEVEGIEAGREQPLSRFTLESPVAGRIQKRDLVRGDTVGPHETPLHVVDLRKVWVLIDAYERDAPLLEPGLRVDLTVPSFPGRSFRGRVDWVSLELEPRTRTLRVRARMDNPDLALRSGMFGTASVRATKEGSHHALVPLDAVQTVEGRTVVFVPGEEEGAFRAVEVRLGPESDRWVEVRDGLAPGDVAVVAGAFDLKATLTARGRSAAHSH